jgi:hypothetical protein
MKSLSKLGLLVAVGLLACAAMAASAQAQVDINPDNTAIVGTAESPTLNYGSALVQCDTGTAAGTTGQDSDFVDVEVQFFGNCNVNGLAAVVDCAEGDFTRLQATDATLNTGIVDALLPGFRCDVEVAGICTITVLDQDLPISGGGSSADLLNEGSNGLETIAADVDVNATRTGSSLCGPASGPGGFSGDYLLDTAVSFD